MNKLFIALRDADEFTRAEILKFVERKLDEAANYGAYVRERVSMPVKTISVKLCEYRAHSEG